MSLQYIDYQAIKPIDNSEDKFGIRDSIVNLAIKQKKLLRISYNGKTAIHDPRWWRKTGEVIYRIYKRPDEPMRLFVNKANLKAPETEEERARRIAIEYCL